MLSQGEPKPHSIIGVTSVQDTSGIANTNDTTKTAREAKLAAPARTAGPKPRTQPFRRVSPPRPATPHPWIPRDTSKARSDGPTFPDSNLTSLHTRPTLVQPRRKLTALPLDVTPHPSLPLPQPPPNEGI